MEGEGKRDLGSVENLEKWENCRQKWYKKTTLSFLISAQQKPHAASSQSQRGRLATFHTPSCQPLLPVLPHPPQFLPWAHLPHKLFPRTPPAFPPLSSMIVHSCLLYTGLQKRCVICSVLWVLATDTLWMDSVPRLFCEKQVQTESKNLEAWGWRDGS